MDIKTPVIIINFKTYEQGTGDNAVKLAKICEKYGVVCAVQAPDIARITRVINTPVIAQHIDNVGYGKHTGSIFPHAVKEAGAIGTLINHSEKRLRINIIEDTIKICKKLELYSIVCAKNPKEAQKIAKLKPDFITIEPPKLIGGKISVSQAKPELITQSVKAVAKVSKNIPVLCGAGIHTKQDVETALKLGAKGIIVASGVVKAKDSEKVLKELVEGLG